MMKQLLILCYLLTLPLMAGAQVCGLAEDQYTINLNGTTTIPFDINNVINDDLADPGQGVCKIEVSLQLGPPIVEFGMWLQSPSGQRVQLIGPNVPSFFPGGPSLLNIDFLPSDQTAVPDFGYPDRWDNTLPSGYPPLFNPGYQGSYYPFSGRLEDFNTGSVNGTWQLIIENNTFFELTPNTLFDLRIILCDDAGQDCCFASAGELRQVDVSACQNAAELRLDLPPSYPRNEIQPGNAVYGYTYAISQGGNLLAFDSIPDLSNYTAGEYEVCGISYQLSEKNLFPMPDGLLTTDSLLRNLQSANPFFCGDLSDNCVMVTILPNADPISIQNTICPGDTLFIGMDTLTTAGLHPVTLTSFNGCDSLLEVDLVFYPSPQIDSVETLCPGDSIRIGNSIYKTSGLYADTLQTMNGCDSIINLDLTVLSLLPAAVIDTICAGESYPVGDSLFTESGLYQVILFANTGCDSIINLALTVLDASAEIIFPDTITCFRPEVVLAAQNNSGNSLNYAWYDANDNLVGSDSLLMVSQAGDYYLEASHLQCNVRDTITVIENVQAPIADAGSPDTLNCGDKTQILLGSLASSQGTAFSYEWSTDTGHFVDANDQLPVTIDSAGIYQLIVTDRRNGCTDTSTVEIIANNIPPVAEAGLNQLITCAAPIATLDASASSQDPDLEYTWIALTGNLQLTADPLRPEATTEGIYELTVRNPANACTSSDQVAVFADTIRPEATIAQPAIISCDLPEVRLNAQLIDGGSNPMIEWMSPGNASITADENTLTPLVIQAGEYRLLVTNPDNGCLDSTQVLVEADLDPPIIEIQAPDTFHCQGQIITLEYLTNSDTSELSIQWLDSIGVVLGTAVTQNVSEPGSYQLAVRNKNNGCLAVESIEVIDDSAPPVISFGDLVKACDVDTFRIPTSIDQDSSLFSIQWTGPGIIAGANELRPQVNSPGDYILTLTYVDAACSFTDIATVIEPPCGPCLETDSAPSFSCRETNLQLEVRYCDECIGCRIEWSTVDGQIRADGNTLTPTIGQAGTYTISVTDTFNITAQLDISVSENRDFPIAEAGQDTTLNCLVSTLQLGTANTDEGAGFQIRWRSQSTGSTSLGNTPFLEVDQSGDYILEVQNMASGCISRDTVKIEIDTTPPLVDAGPNTNLTCLQSTLLLDGANSVSGPDILYQWTASNGGQIDFGANTTTPQISAPGTYILEVINGNNGCSASGVVVVGLENTPPEISLPEPDLLNCAETFTLLEPLNVDTTLFSYEWCALDENGNIFNCTAGAVYEALSAGEYRVQVIDRQSGCSNTATLSVIENSVPPSVNAGPDTTVNCFHNQIQLGGFANTTSGQATFGWTSPNGQILSGGETETPMIDGPGQYILTATDLSNGCFASDTVQVTANLTPPQASLAQDINQLLLNCLVDTLLLDASPSLPVGNEGLNYLWTTEENASGLIGAVDGATIEIIAGGIYELTVQDRANGCLDTLSFLVNINSIKPRISAPSPASLTCLRQEVTLDASGSETGAGIRHRWFFNEQILPNTNLILTVSQGGTYRLESTYLDNGCSNEAVVVVNSADIFPEINIAPPMILDCDNPAAVLDASATMGQSLRFSWSTNNGNIISGQETPVATINTAGLYTLLVIDGNGCSALSSIEVNLTGMSIGQIDLALFPPSCPGESDGSVRVLSVEGGTNPFVFALNDDHFVTADEFTQLPSGSYQLTVMDAAGCEASTTFILQEPEGVNVSLGPDLKIRKGEEVTLQALTNVKEPQNIQWSPAALVGGKDSLVQILQPDRSATYQVKITDERGCIGSSEVQILVSNELPVYVSNAFSPNEDGENDRFFIQASSAVTLIKSFRIFDRWGNTVFEIVDIPPNDPQLGWDGYYRGQLMNTAVFVYFAELELAGGDVEMVQGEVLLVR